MTDFNITVKTDTSSAASDVENLNASLQGAAASADAIGDSASKAGAAVQDAGKRGADSASNADKALQSVNKTLQDMKSFAGEAFAFIGISVGLKSLIDISDQAIITANNIRGLTSSEREAADLQQRLLALADQSRVSFSGAVDLYQRLAVSTQGYNLSQEQMLRILQSVTEEASINSLSLGQVDSAIKLLFTSIGRGAEAGAGLQRVFNQFPDLMQKVASSMGGAIHNVTDLRNAIAAGTVDGNALIKALIDASGVIDNEFQKSLVPVTQALQVFKNNFEAAVADLDKSTGFFSTVSKAILLLADHMEIVIPLVGAFTLALTTLAIVAGVKLLIDGLTEGIEGLSHIVLIFIENPAAGLLAVFALLAVAVGKMAYNYIPAFHDAVNSVFSQIKELTGGMTDGVKSFTDFGNGAGDTSKLLAQVQSATDAATKSMNDSTTATQTYTKALKDERTTLDQGYDSFFRFGAAIRYASDEARGYGQTLDQLLKKEEALNNGTSLSFNLPQSSTGLTDIGTPIGGFTNAFANGGNMPAGQLALVGEKGPELVIPSHSGVVIPADTTAQIMQLASTLAQTTLQAQLTTADPNHLGFSLAGSSLFSPSAQTTAGNFTALQNVFSGGFGGSATGGSGSSAADIGTPLLLPVASDEPLSKLSAAVISQLFTKESGALTSGITAGQITADQASIVQQVLSSSVVDWDAYLKGGPLTSGLLANSNGIFGYFLDMQNTLSTYPWVKYFLAQAFGQQFADSVSSPKPTSSNSGSGSGSGGSSLSDQALAMIRPYLQEANLFVPTEIPDPSGWRSPFDRLRLNDGFYIQSPVSEADWLAAGGKVQGINGFASGGQFNVGGAGGTDSQLVQFMASPDERVTVETPSQQSAADRAKAAGAGNTTHNHISMTINTPDANSFRRSQTQILAELNHRLANAPR